MGCDIHGYIEYQPYSHKPETWYLFAHPFLRRDYALFSLLAGVRNSQEVKPIAEPRGFPENADLETREAYNEDGSDAHSASHLTCEEYEAALNARDNDYPISDVNFRAVLAVMKTFEKERIPTRFVFWFDN